MHELTIILTDAERDALHDLADAQDRAAEELAHDAVHHYLRVQNDRLEALAGRLAQQHAGLLRRLGE
ncbi:MULTISPECIES: hypothetical protein [Streptomyces]|uniref:Uncharacterized protein n=1 Tax=Streptomyces pratisoli TaxID=3139917 RepID=A0ACC6QGF6_9ACTN|nr:MULTISPECIES: hypothetical protein [unclassified Streptomyces]MCX4508781.1 hypothetical protein [Streptomyces sp. NBC_01619]